MPFPKTVWVVAVASGFAALSPSDPPDATRRVSQFENESVRVWRSHIAPGEPLSLHRHEHGRVIVALRGGTLRIVKGSGESRRVTWDTGSAYWLPADPPGENHGDVNEGPEPIEVMVVEVKSPTP